ncbi:MAG: hypothetical protein ACOYOK_08650 [Pseudobdellovibrionaceae bacterium]
MRMSIVLGVLMTFQSAYSIATTTTTENLSAVSLLHKCYANITGIRIPLNHSLLASVKAGTLSGEQACSQLMDRMTFNSSGMINTSASAESQKDAEAGLNHIAGINRSRFGALDFCTTLPDATEVCKGQMDVFDSSIPSIIMTEPVFNPSRNFSDVFTLGRIPYAARTLTGNKFVQYSASLNRDFYINNANRKTAGFLDEIIFPDVLVNTVALKYNIVNSAVAPTALGVDNNLDFPSTYVPTTSRIQIGSLKGIVYDTNYKLRFPSSTDKDPYFLINDIYVNPNIVTTLPAMDLRRTIDKNAADSEGSGGGVIATQEYLMLNFGWTATFKADGVLQMPRRWTQNVFKNFFCRNLPVLRDSDGKNLIVNTAGMTDAQISKVGPFRLASNCASCHGTMDQMASTLRNVTWHANQFSIGSTPGSTVRLVRYPLASSPVGTNSVWRDLPVSGSDTKFHLRAPMGRLYYRSYDGRLIDQSVNGAADLAQKISQTDDVYVCAAKQYFQQFTGIDVSLHDIGDPANASLNKAMNDDDWAARDFVIALGIDLKSHQKMARTIKDILKSKYFTQKKVARDQGGN